MHTDSWAKKAKKLGLRSRAVFKLEEILMKTKALRSNSLVLDIGSSPGGWSQLIKTLKPESRVYAVDLLPMDPIKDVYFYQEDIVNIDLIKEISSIYKRKLIETIFFSIYGMSITYYISRIFSFFYCFFIIVIIIRMTIYNLFLGVLNAPLIRRNYIKKSIKNTTTSRTNKSNKGEERN